ncbi:hypothetical protein [Desulfopila inferna]|uniref:hypothetical protein n=1 Tax=Desulfopila inferna TaxID=468528 RepID=UPI0019664561|nr:hypothetical protein [Desulfopila inferna]MBM9605573.1 hypothetical protein [Desulfopila inferna]
MATLSKLRSTPTLAATTAAPTAAGTVTTAFSTTTPESSAGLFLIGILPKRVLFIVLLGRSASALSVPVFLLHFAALLENGMVADQSFCTFAHNVVIKLFHATTIMPTTNSGKCQGIPIILPNRIVYSCKTGPQAAIIAAPPLLFSSIHELAQTFNARLLYRSERHVFCFYRIKIPDYP